MNKSPKRLRLRSETIRALETAALRGIAGGLPRLRTITCDDECDSYACLTNVGCA
jgi:hypothetical protein